MQQKKNIKLLIIWVILLGITITLGLYKPDADKLDIDKGHFSLREKVNDIDQITIVGAQSKISLLKDGRNWSLNNTFSADPSKINDILGVLSEVSVRRIAASTIQEKLNSDDSNKFKVTLFANDQVIKSFDVAENDQGTLTYFIDEMAYVVNIPGYNYHVADIFNLQTVDWRSPYVFASNWTDLEKMSIKYPEDSALNFDIIYDNLGYSISSIHKLDTSAMYNYMQQVSILQVQSYLSSIDSVSKTPDLSITVKDVGDQQMVLEFYIYEDLTLGHINSQEWAMFDPGHVSLLLKQEQDFSIE